jgi:polyisoprenoid-binding protein YceI
MTTTTAEATQTSLTGRWAIDRAHSRLGFVARHAMVTKVRGEFKEFEGELYIDGEDPTKSSAIVNVKVASVDTANAQRDEHLRTNDFFEAAKFPIMTYKSSGAERVDDTHYRLSGDLTLHGVTRPVTFDIEFTGQATDPFGNARIGFEGTAVLNRKDFGISWNAALEAGGVLVSEKVTVELDISAVKVSDPATVAA